LFLPETKEFEDGVYIKFVPKQHILLGKQVKINSPHILEPFEAKFV